MTPFRLPKSVVCGAARYTIVRESDSRGEMKNAYGYCQPHKAKIAINRALHGDKARQILEHECAHATLEESGAGYIMNQFIADPAAKHALEELLIRVWLPSYQASIGSF